MISPAVASISPSTRMPTRLANALLASSPAAWKVPACRPASFACPPGRIPTATLLPAQLLLTFSPVWSRRNLYETLSAPSTVPAPPVLLPTAWSTTRDTKSPGPMTSSMPSAFASYPFVPCAPMDMISCTSHDGACNIPSPTLLEMDESTLLEYVRDQLNEDPQTHSPNHQPSPRRAPLSVSLSFRTSTARRVVPLPAFSIAPDPRSVTAAHTASWPPGFGSRSHNA